MNKLFIYSIFLLISLLAFPANSIGQQMKISGTVTNFDNQPLDFVSVSVQGSAIGSYTNSKGKYQITTSKSDTITLVFSLMGYQKAERKLINNNGNVTLNIMLRNKEKALSEVTVKGEKAQTTTTQKIEIGNSNLNSDPTGGSIESIIAAQAGVSSTNELSIQYAVRGGNYDENIVYVNGIEIYRPLLIRSGQQEGLSFINPNMTESVNFSSGGFEASYGDKMSSVLDIRYKKPTEFEASVSGSLLGASAYIGSRSGRFSQVSAIRYKTTKNLLGTLDTDAEYEPTFLDAQTYMTLDIAPKWEVSFLGNVSSNKFRFTPESRETSFGTLQNVKNFKVYFDGWEQDKFLTYFGALSLNVKPIKNLSLGIMGSAFSSKEYERYDISGEYRLSDLTSNGTENNDGALSVGSYLEHARNNLDADVSSISHIGEFSLPNHTLKWGATAQREKINDKISEWTMRDSAGYSLPHLPNVVGMSSSLKSKNSTNTNRYSGYLQDTYRIIANENIIYINAGIRASYWSFNEELTVSPRASIAFIPGNHPNITLRFATGIYYQAPFYKEYQRIVTNGETDYIELNKDIKSPRSLQFILGGDYKFKVAESNFKFSSDVYYKKLSDLIPYTVNNVKIRYAGENLSSGYAMGLDMKLFGEFVPGTDSWISLSLMKTQQDINGVKVPLPTDQSYNISVYFQDYFPGMERITMNFKAHLSQGLPQAGPNAGYFDKGYHRSPAYKRLDIGFAWQALGKDFSIRNRNSFWGSFKNIWLGVDIFNLFDFKNTNSYYWVTDVAGKQYGVPNYLTGRQLNAKIVAEF